MVEAFFNDRAGQAAIAIGVVGIIQFLLAQAALIRDHAWTIIGVTEWLRLTGLGVIFPIWLLLFLGWAAQGVQLIGGALMLAGLAWAGIYVAEAVGRILSDWVPKQAAREIPPEPQGPLPPPL